VRPGKTLAGRFTWSYEGGDPPYALFTIVVFRILLAGLVLLFAVPHVRSAPGRFRSRNRPVTTTALQQEGRRGGASESWAVSRDKR